MKNVIRWGLATGLAAALAVFGNAQAQSATGSSSGSSAPGGEASKKSGESTTSAEPGKRASDTGQTQTGREGGTAAGTETGAGRAGAGQAGQKVDKGLQEKLEKIHAANQAEVHLAQAAAQNAQSPEVKQFAEQMHQDHQGLGEKLTAAAQSAGITSLEGKTYQKEHERAMKDNEKVQSKTGAEFDREFMSKMVKDHEKSVKDTESAAKDARKANQTELASFLENANKGMKGHLDHAKQLRSQVGRGGGEQMRQGRRPAGGSEGAAQPGTSGSRGDTGGPPPRGSATPPGTGGGTSPQGGAPGSSSEGQQGQQQPRQ